MSCEDFSGPASSSWEASLTSSPAPLEPAVSSGFSEGALAGRVGGPRMSTTTYLIPVVAIVLGVAFRDETVAPIAVLGVVVVLAGAYLASRAVRVLEAAPAET